MKPDLLLTQIKHCDYPVFRLFLKRYRNFFGKITVFFNENNRFPYLDHFMHSALESLGDILFLDQTEIDWGKQDWRNVSTNYMLHFSTSEWVCSVEQDFFSKDWDRLLNSVRMAMKTNDLIGWWQENNKYIHPSFWFIRRELLNQTNKDFAAHDGHDHFGWITKDVEKLNGKIKTTQEMGFKDFTDCFHLGGVNQNYLEGLKPEYVFHRPDWFYIYNYWCRKADVIQSPLFTEISLKIEERLKRMFPNINPEIDNRLIYFK